MARQHTHPSALPRPIRTGCGLARVASLALALIASPPLAHAVESAPSRRRLDAARIVPPVPPPRPDRPSEPPQPAMPDKPAPFARGPADSDPAACLDRLGKLGVGVQPLPAISAGACGARYPFRLAVLPNGIDLVPVAQVSCPIAEALARWVNEAVSPEARTHLGRAPVKLLIGASYECRGRNRVPGATLSEHAFANAIDIMGFVFAQGAPLPVKAWPAETPEGRFLSAIRSRACGQFTTVLGPGSDATHHDHLHLDLRERKRGFRMCQ